ncbi:MAG TPA: hypothetical protein VHB21_03115, partial [Minicystis sp.]|nr:hypothetical protein [Minicystis sp.]
AAGDLDGDYFRTIAANLSPTKVVSLAGHLTTVEKNGSLVVTIKAQALYSVDRKTPVGGMISPKPATVQKDGSAVFDFGNLVVDGCADALICGTEIDAQNVVVTAPPGSYCGKPTFICGTITGKVTKPIADDLGSPNPSTWTMQTWDGHTTPSKVVTDCAMDVADPPPTTCQGCP